MEKFPPIDLLDFFNFSSLRAAGDGLLTAEQVKAEFAQAGISVGSWAKKHGFSRAIVYGVLSGSMKAAYGEAHRVAVALRMKHGVIADPASFMAPTVATDHQAICVDVIGAYASLHLVDQAELEAAFAGELNVAAIHSLAQRMLKHTPPEVMSLVLTRLIVMSSEGEERSQEVH